MMMFSRLVRKIEHEKRIVEKGDKSSLYVQGQIEVYKNLVKFVRVMRNRERKYSKSRNRVAGES